MSPRFRANSFAGLALLIFAAATPLLSQAKVTQSGTGPDARLAGRFSSLTAHRLQIVVDSAVGEGLPANPLILRALEGQAKGVADDKVIEVVSRLHIDLQQARQTLGTTSTPDELTSAAAAIKAGVSPDKLSQLQHLRGKQPLTAPLDAWLGLVNRGANRDLAWDHITGLAKRQARDAEFSRLTPADLTRGIKGRP